MSISKKLNYSIFRYDSDVIPTNPTLLFFTTLRDRPFNLKGGGLWFFASFRIFFPDNTRVRIFLFFPPPKSEYFFKKANYGNMIY
jgi:hypothetical protein